MMKQMWNGRASWLGAAILALALLGCGDDGSGGGGRVLGGPTDRMCVCPGLPGRMIQTCESFPFDGSVKISATCAPSEANRTGFCEAVVETSNSLVLALFPPVIQVPADNQVHFFKFDTVGNLIIGSGQEVEVFSNYILPNGQIKRVSFGSVRVSEICPF